MFKDETGRARRTDARHRDVPFPWMDGMAAGICTDVIPRLLENSRFCPQGKNRQDLGGGETVAAGCFGGSPIRGMAR